MFQPVRPLPAVQFRVERVNVEHSVPMYAPELISTVSGLSQPSDNLLHHCYAHLYLKVSSKCCSNMFTFCKTHKKVLTSNWEHSKCISCQHVIHSLICFLRQIRNYLKERMRGLLIILMFFFNCQWNRVQLPFSFYICITLSNFGAYQKNILVRVQQVIVWPQSAFYS